jgi:hypothetical protein
MPRSNPLPELGGDRGSAAVEFLTMGVLLLVPIVYLVLTLAALQGAAFAAEGVARQAARLIATGDTEAAGRSAADAAVRVGLADWRVPAGAAAVTVTCSPRPDDCLTPRGTVRVTVRVGVALPLMPPALAVNAPGVVPVEAHALQPVSMFRVAP